jgi:hypothetical protein
MHVWANSIVNQCLTAQVHQRKVVMFGLDGEGWAKGFHPSSILVVH